MILTILYIAFGFVVLTASVFEYRARTKYKIRWVCLCGNPTKSTVYWEDVTYGHNSKPENTYTKRKIGPVVVHYYARCSEGQPKYDTCPDCGRPPTEADRYPCKLRGFPFMRRAVVAPRVAMERLERFSNSEL